MLQVIKLSTPNNRQKLFDKVDEYFVMGDSHQVLEVLIEQLIKQLFEILKDEDAPAVKEMAINQLSRLLRNKADAISGRLTFMIEEIAIAYYLNKKVRAIVLKSFLR